MLYAATFEILVKSLYARLLVGFLTVLLLATSAFYRAYTAVTVPPIIRLIGSTQAALANESAIAMHQGGSGAASAYLQRLASATQRQHYLVDGNGRDVVTGDDRSAMLPPDPGPGRIRLKEDGDRVVFATPAGSEGLLLISIAPVPFQPTDFLRYVAVITGVVIALFLLLVATVVHPSRRRVGPAVRPRRPRGALARGPAGRDRAAGVGLQRDGTANPDTGDKRTAAAAGRLARAQLTADTSQYRHRAAPHRRRSPARRGSDSA